LVQSIQIKNSDIHLKTQDIQITIQIIQTKTQSIQMKIQSIRKEVQKKKLIHPNRFLFKLADKVYKEIDHFFISQENHFGCQEMLQIVFIYKDLKNIDRHKIWFLSSQDPGFIIEDEIEEKICENYKK